MGWIESLTLGLSLLALGLTALVFLGGRASPEERESADHGRLSEARHEAVRSYVAARWREDGRTDLAQRIEICPDDEVLKFACEAIRKAFLNTFSTQNPQVRETMLAEYKRRNGGSDLRAMLELVLDRTQDEHRFR